MKREVVLITGSSGRIGSRLVNALAGKYQTVGMDFVGTTSREPSMEFIFVDLSSDQSVDAALQRVRYAYGGEIASIVHLAAYYSFAGVGLENYEKITIRGTERLLRGAKAFKVGQFIFTSTLLAHAATEPGKKITEESPLVGKWDYPASKIATEKLLLAQHGDIPVVFLRVAGCYDGTCNCVPLSQHIQRVYEKGMTGHLYPGDITHGAALLHFEDLNDAIVTLIERRESLPKELAFILAEEDVMTYADLQHDVGMLLYGKPWYTIHVPKAFAKFGAYILDMLPGEAFIKPWMIDLADDHYEVDVSHARKVLGWSPKHSLRRELPAIIADFKKDPIAWYKRHKIPLSGFVKRHGVR